MIEKYNFSASFLDGLIQNYFTEKLNFSENGLHWKPNSNR